MRVAVLVDALGAQGGVETYLEGLAAALREAGHEFRVLTGRCALSPSYAVEIVPARGWTRTGRLLAYARAVLERRAEFDVTLAFRHVLAADVYMPHGGFVGAAWEGRERSLGGGRVRRWIRRTWRRASRRARVFEFLERSAISSARFVVALSERVAAEYRERHPRSRTPLVSLPLGVDLERHRPEGPREDLGARWALPQNAVRVLFAGYNVRLKGLRFAAAAVARVPQAHLFLCGPTERAVAPEWKSLLRDRIHVLGSRNDMPSLYRSVDVLLHPTHYDPCSLVVLEALACGTPCVTTLRNGASEVGGDGLRLVPEPEDVEGLVRSLQELLASGPQARAAARTSVLRRDAKDHFAALIQLLERARQPNP